MEIKSYRGVMDDAHSQRHKHSTHQILIVHKGVLLFADDYRQSMLSGDNAAFVPKELFHQAQGIDTEFDTVYFCDEAFCQLSGYNIEKLPRQVIVFQTSRLFHELLQEICRNSFVDSIISKTSLKLLLHIFVEHKKQLLPISLPKSSERRLAKALTYIDDNYPEVILLDDLARVAATSKRNLERICKRELHINISEYICMRRIFAATIELATTDDSVLEVSLNVGYNSLSSFYKSFQKLVGQTPKDYRNSLNFQRAIMENITGKEFLSSIESNTIYDNCTFYLGEQHFFKVKNSHFHNCGFYNSALFSQLENCKFIDCDFIGKFALELKNLKTLPMEIFDYGFLTHLTIASSKMELPTTIDKLQNLIELRVIFCEIKALPKEIGNLKCLRTLDLTGNKILQLPKEIGKLTQLQTLLLHGNELTKLPRQIGNLSQLKRLELIMLLGRLPVEISNLHHLEYLCGYIDERDDILLQALLPKCTVETFSGKVPPPKQVFICEQLYH